MSGQGKNFQPRICTRCGEVYTPTNQAQVRCKPCMAAVKAGAPKVLEKVITGTVVVLVPESPQASDGPTRPMGRVLSRKEWAVRIRTKYSRALGAAVAVGMDLIAARAQIPPGQWLDFVDTDLGMAERTVQRFMRVAHHEVLSDPECQARLPASMRTLSDLAGMQSGDLRTAIEAGHVTPDTERAEAVRVRKAYESGNPDSLGAPKPPKVQLDHLPPTAAELAGELAGRDPQATAAANAHAGILFARAMEDVFRWAAAVLAALGRELPSLAGDAAGAPHPCGSGEVVSFPSMMAQDGPEDSPTIAGA